MELFKKTSLSWDDKDYEIRVLYDERKISIVAFQNNHPANGFRHQIRLWKGCNVQEILEQDIVGELVEISKNEIVKNSWNKLSKNIRQSQY